VPASPPGTSSVTVPDSLGGYATADFAWDPDTFQLAGQFVTTTGQTQLNLQLICAGGVPVYTWQLPPGAGLARSDLAQLLDADGLPLTRWDQLDGPTFSAS
jgi:hypothetical protein